MSVQTGPRPDEIEGGFGSGMVVKRRFVSGAAIDERLAEIDATTGAGLVTDRQNSVLAVLDAQGNPVVRRGYGTYGETDPAQMTGAGGASHPFGYTGRRWDPDLGLYYYRARWYDPQLGTFLQTDPIGTKDYINLYSYVGLNPGNATDPSGLKAYVSGNRVFIEPEDGVGLKVNIPNNVGARGFQPNWGRLRDWKFHKYNVTTDTNIIATPRTMAAFSDALIANPTPGFDRPASPTGSRNDIGPLPIVGEQNFVRSYVIRSPDPTRMTDIVVNYTIAGEHGLEEGFVMRWGEVGANGNIILRSYGEGNGIFQLSVASPVWGLAAAKVWKENHQEIINQVMFEGL